jgi:NADP-dependent 3-hydroxy acid dehydrogenase YdfG
MALAIVTGASSGIGAATVRRLRADGWDVLAGARRTDRLDALADETGAQVKPLDVTDPDSVAAFCEGITALDLLVNNAGGAHRLDKVEDADDEDWRWMFEVNVLGVVRMTRALLPALRASGNAQLINVGSTAGHAVYPGGSAYNAAKYGVAALTEALRMELIGEPIRITEIAPGMVAETEFSIVRFEGDTERAAKVYEGVEALVPGDIADAIAWTAARPAHVNIDLMIVKPRDQVNPWMVHRRG